MPLKLGTKLPPESTEARIEIVPLIDIMFFLLAAFMLVSLSMVNMKSVKVNLPAAAGAITDTVKNVVDISVDQAGATYLDKTPIASSELVRNLTGLRIANPNLRVIISGDAQARHGQIIHVLDLVRAAGIDKVAFEISPTDNAARP